MSTATVPSTPAATLPSISSAQHGLERSGDDAELGELSLYIAGRGERESLAQLVTRAGAAQPAGALMVAAADRRLLAAGSISTGEVVSEPGASGAAAAAVLRYRLASLRRRRGHRALAPAA